MRTTRAAAITTTINTPSPTVPVTRSSHAVRAVAALALGVGCGGESARTAGDEASSVPLAPVPAQATPATRADPASRTVVAIVNGEPIYDDCVATQASAFGVGLTAALDRCIDFEVLAQESARRGLLADPEVLAAHRTEMVRALVETEFAPTLDDPSDVAAADLRWLWDTQLTRRYNRPERRRATYCRAPVADHTAVGGPEYQAARKLADELHAALSHMRGLDAGKFAALCWMAAGGREVKTTSIPTQPFSVHGRHESGAYAVQFAEAAFRIPEVGHVSPPTRTSWGWDVILLTDILPAETSTLDQAEPEIRDMLIHRADTSEYRARKFREWVSGYVAAARIEQFPDNLPDDQALAQRGAPLPGARP